MEKRVEREKSVCRRKVGGAAYVLVSPLARCFSPPEHPLLSTEAIGWSKAVNVTIRSSPIAKKT